MIDVSVCANLAEVGSSCRSGKENNVPLADLAAVEFALGILAQAVECMTADIVASEGFSLDISELPPDNNADLEYSSYVDTDDAFKLDTDDDTDETDDGTNVVF